jgi:hypothetical protein
VKAVLIRVLMSIVAMMVGVNGIDEEGQPIHGEDGIGDGRPKPCRAAAEVLALGCVS